MDSNDCITAREYTLEIPTPKLIQDKKVATNLDGYVVVPLDERIYWLVVDDGRIVGLVDDFKNREFTSKQRYNVKLISRWIDVTRLTGGTYVLDVLLNKVRLIVRDVLKTPDDPHIVNKPYKDRLAVLATLPIVAVVSDRLRIVRDALKTTAATDVEEMGKRVLARHRYDRSGITDVIVPMYGKHDACIVGYGPAGRETVRIDLGGAAKSLDNIPVGLRHAILEKYHQKLPHVVPTTAETRADLHRVLLTLLEREEKNGGQSIECDKYAYLIGYKNKTGNIVVFGQTDLKWDKCKLLNASSAAVVAEAPDCIELNPFASDKNLYFRNFHVVRIRQVTKILDKTYTPVRVVVSVSSYPASQAAQHMRIEEGVLAVHTVSLIRQKLMKATTDELVVELTNRLKEELFLTKEKNDVTETCYQALKRKVHEEENNNKRSNKQHKRE